MPSRIFIWFFVDIVNGIIRFWFCASADPFRRAVSFYSDDLDMVCFAWVFKEAILRSVVFCLIYYWSIWIRLVDWPSIKLINSDTLMVISVPCCLTSWSVQIYIDKFCLIYLARSFPWITLYCIFGSYSKQVRLPISFCKHSFTMIVLLRSGWSVCFLRSGQQLWTDDL